MTTLNISIAGLGNVGSNLVKIIEENYHSISYKSSLNINIVGISAKNKSKNRIFDVKKYEWYDNPINLLDINNTNIFIELIGEEKGISFDLVKEALQKKINVITANKALLANHGNELFKIAEDNSVKLLFEAAVAGGIPIIKTIKSSIFLNNIKKISGILNGTTNYILSEMENSKSNFDEVLKDAKSKGFAEQDSTNDIEGIDSAHKLSLLSAICFGSKINFKNVDFQGISNIQIDDIINAKKLGYKIKLISTSELIDNKIYNVVEPLLIKQDSQLANVNNVLNGIIIQTDQLKSLFLEGEGAGGRPTASSIMSDIYDIYENNNNLSLGYKIDNLKDFERVDNKEKSISYYLRIYVEDIPGVLAKITSILNNFGVSIETILQMPEKSKNSKEVNKVPIIITTHETTHKLLKNSLSEIENLKFVISEVTFIKIDKSIY